MLALSVAAGVMEGRWVMVVEGNFGAKLDLSPVVAKGGRCWTRGELKSAYLNSLLRPHTVESNRRPWGGARRAVRP